MFKKSLFSLLFLFVFSIESISAQCAMCKAVIENGDVPMAEGINNGITYLMVFPYVLVGILFFVIYRFKKRSKI